MQAIKQIWKIRLTEVQGLAENTLLMESQSVDLLAHQILITGAV